MAVLWGVCGLLLPALGFSQPVTPITPTAAPTSEGSVKATKADKPAADKAKPVADKSKPAPTGAAPASGEVKSDTKSDTKSDAKKATPAATRAGTKTAAGKGAGGKAVKAPVTPPAEPPVAKLPLPPKSSVLSKAEQFQRAAPATVMLVAQQDSRFNTALGVIVKPQGVVVSDSRLLSGVETGQVFAFRYDPALAGDEDPLIFLRTHKDAALPTQVVRVDPANHLVMLQLPAAAPKKPYPSLDLFEVEGITTVGLDVVALRTRGRQTLAMFTGSIAAMRPELMELEPELTVEASGAPILSPTGRLIGVATFADKSVSLAGIVRPVNVLNKLLLGKIGGAPVKPDAPSAPEVGVESRNGVEALRIALGVALGQKFEKKQALQLHSDFIASMALHGRVPIAMETGEQLNGLLAGLIKDNPPKTKAANALFPILVTDKAGKTWQKVEIKDTPRYGSLRPSGSGLAAIDDVTGQLYATDPHQQLMWYDAPGKSWRNTGLSPVIHARATDGVLYVIVADGRLLVAGPDGKDATQLYPRNLNSAFIEASQGWLYLVESGSIYRYHNKAWENKLKPIAFAMQQLAVRGDSWYGLDMSGRVFSSIAARYIDRDGNIARLWGIGKDLLVLTKDSQRFFYNVAEDSWMPWAQW